MVGRFDNCCMNGVIRCVCVGGGGTHLLPLDFESRVSEGLTVLMDLLDDALVVHNGGVIVPQQSILPALLGVVTYLCQIHGE